MRKVILSIATFVLAAAVIIPGGKAVAGDEGEAAVTSPALVVSATRYEMPQSQVASDITVITKEEISHLPVHDVGEAISYSTGIALDRNGSPGTYVTPYIQGSDPRHVKVFLDGVPLDLLSEGVTDFSMIPIENVQSIEILKGAASSVWGSSLGGVVNIRTKKPSDKPTGEAGASLGENGTKRYNAIISGKTAGVGYFISGSQFETDGFIKGQDAVIRGAYIKFTKDFQDRLDIEGAFGYNDIKRGFGDIDLYFPDWDVRDAGTSDNKQWDNWGRLGLNYRPNSEISLSLSGYQRNYYYRRFDHDIYSDSSGTYLGENSLTFQTRERNSGIEVKGSWKHTGGTLAGGIEGSQGGLSIDTIDSVGPSSVNDLKVDKAGYYINENLSLGRFNLNAGTRYDYDSAFGSQTSPSAGIVLDIKEISTLFRINVARGFSTPPLTYRYEAIYPNKALKAERAWSYQAGLESTAIPSLWAKVTIFRADVEDGVECTYDELDADGDFRTWDILTCDNVKRMQRKGIEVEARTKEYKGIALSYGYAFNDIRDLDQDKILKDMPRVTQDIGLDYRGPFDTRTTLKGHYVSYNPDRTGSTYEITQDTHDKKFIWDIKVSKYFAKWSGLIGEAFMSVHNIADEDQYLMKIYPNPGRWVEGGVSLTFY